jgi:peroxiredoxin
MTTPASDPLPHGSALPLGSAAPEFDLPTVAGGRIRLADVASEVFVYVQGCNHCPVVLAYVDRLQALARAYAGRATFVMVNANDAERYPDDSFAAMRAFADAHDLAFPYAWDADQQVALAYRTVRTPEVLVFDRARRLRYRGRVDDAKEPTEVARHDLREALEDLLAGRPVAVPETWAVGCTVKWTPEHLAARNR